MNKPLPDINEFAQTLVFQIGDTVPTRRQREKLDALVRRVEYVKLLDERLGEHRHSCERLGNRERKDIIAALHEAAQRLKAYQSKLQGALSP